MTASPAALAGGLDRINQRFLAKLEDQCRVLDQLLEAGQGADTLTSTEALYVLHKIAGVAGTLGHTALGQASRACEQQLQSDIAVTGQPSPAGLAAIAEFRHQAANLLQR